nr:3'-5' exonuclease [Pseudomonas sp. LS-2]
MQKSRCGAFGAPRGVIKSTAGAGCGKTTALKGAALDCREAGATRLLVLAFSKTLIESLQTTFGDVAAVRTFNSLAFEWARTLIIGRSVGQVYPSHVIEAFDLSRKKLPIEVMSFAKVTIAILMNYCHSSNREFGKQHIPGWVRDPVVGELGAKYAVVLFNALRPGSKTKLHVPHEVYVKAWQLDGCPGLSTFDQVYMDEANDATDVMLSCLAFARRACYVGDAGQQISSFRGSKDAMLKVPGKQYPLTLSFRFGPQIASLANQILSKKTTPPSICLRGMAGKPSRVGPISAKEQHTRLFRTNVGVIRDAMALSDMGESYAITGDMADLRDKILSTYALLRNAKNEARHPAYAFFKNHEDLAEWSHAHPTTEAALLYSLARDYSRRESDLNRLLTGRARDTNPKIQLMTCVRAKGREFNNVVIRDDFQYSGPSRGASPPPIGDEELNTLYVGVTRARLAVEMQPTI